MRNMRAHSNPSTPLTQFLATLAIWLLCLAPGAHAASVGAGGYTNNFSSAPLVTDWSTYTIAGAAANLANSNDLNSAAQAVSASAINSTLVTDGSDPAAANGLATWSSVGQYVQTRPTGNNANLLMVRLQNNSGADASKVIVSYDFSQVTSIAEDVPGHLVYYSLSGAANSWIIIPELCSASPGRLSATLSVVWPNGGTLYLMWADDNGANGTDNPYQIDNFSVTWPVPAAITQSPANQTVTEGNPATFMVTAVGDPNYQWYRNGVLIPNATNRQYTLDATPLSYDQSQFFVVASNFVNNTAYTATSGVAVLTVLADTNTPAIERILPAAGSGLALLSEIEILFSEPVTNVDAGDLLINGLPATNLLWTDARQYIFQFSQPATGTVQVAWAPGHGITDQAAAANPFSGGEWTYLLDPGAVAPILINEILANNKNGYPNAKRDIDGDFSDWLELYNSGNDPVNLQGWFLTDDPANLTKWTFPQVTLQGHRYLMVWCSGKTNVTGQLHANFKLAAEGSFLALVNPLTNIVAQFAPYPPQSAGVSYGVWPGTTADYAFFSIPTPEALNNTTGAASQMAPPIEFSVASRTFVSNFFLTLSTTNPAATIFYTTTTNLPTTNMTRYTGPIAINGTVYLRARAFAPGMLPGEVRSESYIKLDATTTFAGFTNTAATFNSDLPVVVFHNYGGGAVPASEYSGGYAQFAMIQVFEPVNGRTYLTNAPTLTTIGGIHRRGQATAGLPKNNLRVEFRGEYFQDRDLELLGMPAEADWVFYAINGYDKILMRNPLCHELYRQMGHYTSRTRFVEVFIKKDSGTPGPLTATDYQGLYVIEEKIKINKDRIDIDQLTPTDTTPPAVTGGYLFSVDKNNPGSAFTAANQSMWYLDPDYYTIVPAQSQYLINYLNNAYNSFAATTGTNFDQWIDVPLWIDNHLHNTMVNNADMFRISAYWIKPRNGKWAPACLWDFDRGCAMYAQDGDARGFSPVRWHSGLGDRGTDPFNNDGDGGYANPWFSRLFQNIDWFQMWIDRYQELRTSVYSFSNVTAVINRFGAQINEATAREYAKAAAAWPGTSSDTRPNAGTISADGFTYAFPNPGTWQGQLQWIRVWFTNRLQFIDSNFLDRPTVNRPAGLVTPGVTVTLTPAAKAGSSVYYTLDGTDPRLLGGGINPAALSSAGPVTITISNNMRICARSRNPNHSNLTGAHNPPLNSIWSGPIFSTYAVATPQLAITEIMFNPAPAPAGNTNDANNFEFIELKNIGASPINLGGFRFTNGLSFVFPTNVLAPGQYTVVVKNRGAFASRYPQVTNIAGEFGAANLDNNGERLTLVGPFLEPVVDFSYDNSWYRMTRGNGFSLVLANENIPFDAYTNAASWRLSALEHGSPGAQDPAASSIPPVYVSEVVANPVPGQPDTIELYNPNAFDVDIGNWYLSDDFGAPKKYRLPSPTVIPALGYVIFTSDAFNNPVNGANAFALGARGDSAYLFSGNADGLLTGYYHGFDFGPSPVGASYGRLVTSVGDDKFVLLTNPTLGTNNAAPVVGPVVINEIMYQPPDLLSGTNLLDNQADEFVEIYNAGSESAPLYDPAFPTNTWHLRDAVRFVFPQGVVLPPNGFALIVSFDPNTNAAALADFRARYSLTNGTLIFGPYDGKLNNADDSVELVRPGTPELLTGTTLYTVPEVLVDKVAYVNTTPWPCGSGGTGNSLQRLQAGQFGNDPANWVADVPTPGVATVPKPAGLPTIINQPLSVAIPTNGNATFTVGVCGLPPFYYQWSFNGTNLDNATNAYLNVNAAQLADAGAYVVAVSNAAGVTYSLPANLYVQTPPAIAGHPVGLTALGYTTVSFSVTPAGTPPFQYQWRFNGDNLPGATNQTLVLTNIQGSQAGNYRVLVYNTAGSVLSSNAQLTINLPAKIWTQPTNTLGTNLLAATLSVYATGHGVLTYQWFFGGTPLPNATNATLVLTNLSLAHDGYYSVVVSNLYGVEESQAARLHVLMTPVYTLNLTNQIADIGANVTWRIAVVGSEPMRRQWVYLGSPLPGYGYDRNSDTMVLTNVHPGQMGIYRATVTNEMKPGGVNSANAFLAVVVPPTDAQGLLGSTAILRAQVGGLITSYQWRRHGTNLPNGTSTNLVLTNLTASHAGQYEFLVKNGTVTNSYFVNLTVQETGTPPVIVQGPPSRTVPTNLHTIFLVTAAGTEPLSMQWYRNGTNLLVNATNRYYVVTNVQPAVAGVYQVVITNAYGAVTSSPALLSVGAPVGNDDADGDGIPDTWEAQYGLSGGNAGDANQDADRDGLSNLHEYLAGTNPTNALSTLKLNVLQTVGVSGGAVYEFSAAPDKSYTVQYRDSLAAGSWQKLFDVTASGTNRTIAVTNTGAGMRFIRIATPMQP